MRTGRSGEFQPSFDFDEHLVAGRLKRVGLFGFDGANFNLVNVDSSGALLVAGQFTATVGSAFTVTSFIAGSVTLFAVVNVGAAGGTTAFIAGSVTLNAVVGVAESVTLFAVVNTGAAAGVTAFIAGSVTLNALVNTNVTGFIGDRVTTLFEPRMIFVPPIPTQLSNLPARYGIAVAASASNTLPIYYGFTSTVTSGIGFANSGGELFSRKVAVNLEVDNANRVWLVSAPAATMIADYVAV